MPIRYFIDLDCTPREELGRSGLLSMLARSDRAESIRQQFLEKYQVGDEKKMRFREKVTTADGEPEKREMSVADLKKETQPLDDLKHHCRGCPAALTGESYSCVGVISFPISEAAENWLVEQIPPSGSRSLELFLDACSRNNYGQSEMLKNWRKAGFFERSEPVQGERDGILVTSDQVLNELFFVGDLQPSHQLGVLIHLQALKASDGREGDELLDLIEGVDEKASAEESPMIDFALQPQEGSDATIRELIHFLFASFRAFSIQLPLGLRL